MAKRESCVLILFKMVLLVTLLLSALVFGYFSLRDWLNDYFNRGETVEVPDFRGKHIATVFKEKPSRINIEKRDEKFDPKVPKDHVVAQHPPPGTRVKPDKKILLTISLGNRQVRVPKLIGKNVRESVLMLLNAQLLEGSRSYISSREVPKDRVIAQSPMPSAAAGVSGGVDILLSAGEVKPKVPLPNLVGKTIAEAKTNLVAWGMRLGRVLSKKDPAVPNLQVLATNPSPYERLSEGTVVDILISSGANSGSARWSDIRQFEMYDGVSSRVTPRSGATPMEDIRPPKILIADDPKPGTPQITIQNTPAAPSIVPPPPVQADTKRISFVMPDGFMPKEVKFFHVTSQGRKQVYANMHRPLELIRVEVPRVVGSKVQIYINDVPIEEQAVE